MADAKENIINGMTDALGSLFFSIYNMNLETNELSALCVSDDVKGLIGKDTMCGDEFVKILAEVFYHTQCQQELIHTFSADSLRKFRADGIDKVEREFLRMYKGSYRRVNMVACLGNGEDPNIILAVQDVDEQYKKQQNQYHMIQSLSSVYYTMYYVDVDQNLLTAIDNRMDSDIMLTNRGNFTQLTSIYANNCIHYDDREEFLEFMSLSHFRKCLSYENPFLELEYRRMYDYGMEWIRAEVILVNMEDTDLKRVLVATRNITDSKMEATKMAAMPLSGTGQDGAVERYYKKTDFLNQIAQHFTFPANALLGLANAAELYASDEDKVRQLMHEVKCCGMEMQHVGNLLSDMSKIEKGTFHLHPEPVPVVDFFSSLIEDWEENVQHSGHHLAAKQEVFTHEIVRLDRHRIKQIFDSVMDNAVRYTPKGGELVFAIQEVTCYQPGITCFEMIFKDNGIGMSEEVLSHIFDPFLPVADKRVATEQGLALSMPIVRAIVEKMQGTIDIQSQLNKGTTVHIKIYPELDGALEKDDITKKPVKEVEAYHEIEGLGGKKILVFDKRDSLAKTELASVLSLANLQIEQLQSLEEVEQTFFSSPLDTYQMMIVSITPSQAKECAFAKRIHSLERVDALDMPIAAFVSEREQNNAIVEELENAGFCEVIEEPLEGGNFMKMLGWWIK